jgi:glycosyltransferase involved in cell wall biosynthesis
MDRALFEKPAHTIPNGFDADEFAVGEAAPTGAFQIVYMGRVDAMQRLDVFMKGLRLARETVGDRFDVSFVYRGYGAATVARIAAEEGVADLVDAGGHVERDQALGFMRNANMLLLLSIRNDDVYFARGFYPAKTFEYFGARRPILCVPGDGGVLDALLDETRTGVVCATPDAVTRHIVAAYETWHARGAVPYDADADSVSRFTRKHQASRLASVLDSIVAIS